MASIPSIKKIKKLEGKRVLVRVDFNVPVEKGRVMDDFKFQATLPTIVWLLEKEAKIIIASHLGRPKGKIVPEFSTAPLARHLARVLHKKVKHLPVCTGKKVEAAIALMKPGDILFLENVQFDPGENSNDPMFAQMLASYADYFVLDAFGQSHRRYASLVEIQKYVKSYAGLLLEKEVVGLWQVTKKARSPLVAIIGGAKMETKVPVMKALLPQVDHLLIGGGIHNTYLAARGYGVGDSLVDNDFKDIALVYGKKKKVVLPVDIVVGTEDGKEYRVVDIQKEPHRLCKRGEAIYDMGPRSIRLFAPYIKNAQTLLWNGAMGYFEQPPYHVGTYAIARLVASRSRGRAFGVIGGGETVQAMEAVGHSGDIDLVSTGGGAMLEFLAGKKLPGIVALTKSKA